MRGFVESIAFQPPMRDRLAQEDAGRRNIWLLSLNPADHAPAAAAPSAAAPAAPAASTASSPEREFVSFVVAHPSKTSPTSPSMAADADRLRSHAGLVVLYAHGNAEDLQGGAGIQFVGLARNLGVPFVAYDYLGYGYSSPDPSALGQAQRAAAQAGGPAEEQHKHPAVKAARKAAAAVLTEANAYRAIRAMLTWLTVDCGVPLSRVVLFGRSLGSGSATNMAFEVCTGAFAPLWGPRQARSEGAAGGERPAGLVLYSPLYSAVSCVSTALSWLGGWADIFKNYAKIGAIFKSGVPVLIIHGTEDEVIAFEGPVKLLGACGGRVPKPRPAGKSGEGSEAGGSGTSSSVCGGGGAVAGAAKEYFDANAIYAAQAPAGSGAGAGAGAAAEPPRNCYLAPMDGCGHNDIEHRLPGRFFNVLRLFLGNDCRPRDDPARQSFLPLFLADQGRGSASAAAAGGDSGAFRRPGQAPPPVTADDPAWVRRGLQ